MLRAKAKLSQRSCHSPLNRSGISPLARKAAVRFRMISRVKKTTSQCWARISSDDPRAAPEHAVGAEFGSALQDLFNVPGLHRRATELSKQGLLPQPLR